MKQFTIFQLNENNNEAHNFMYMGYYFIKKHNMKLTLDLYNKVYEGNIAYTTEQSETNILDEIYRTFNMAHPADFKGHSLSTSDIVLMDGKYFYCDSYGWTEVKFEQPKEQVKVDLEEMNGQKYIVIYEVLGSKKEDGKSVTLDRYLNKEEAQEYKDFCYEAYSDMYNTFYIYETIVWC